MFYIERKHGLTILKVWQELDIASHAAFDSLLRALEAESGRIIVSLERCSFCDSTGLNALLRAHGRLGARLTVVVPPDANSRRIFEVCRFPALVPVASSMREALGIGA